MLAALLRCANSRGGDSPGPTADAVNIAFVEVVGFILGAIGVVLAIVSILLVFGVERARKPRIVMEPGQGHWPEPSPFAHIAVMNQRPHGWLGRHFRGVTVTNCRASIEFLRDGVSVLGPISARWSGAREPRDVADFPDSYRWDLAATGQPEQIAVARTQDGVVHAFSAESYAHGWQRPGWQLEPGTYDVVVRLASTEAEARKRFRLIVGSGGDLWLGEPT
jgi:hypothetical protein